ncbi:Sphingosine kinase 1 [Dimargaris verticillata]|uniref:Sphingosine kinase 1 n=1 Tax=Dimargaris verticillata TaxID=2761393 RepID=A0A9W8EC26_9FUNG|nr:Sphingosine kinase 1 [Dimargaris verticillata]
MGVLQGLLSVDTDAVVFKDQTRARSLMSGRRTTAPSSSNQVIAVPLYSIFGACLTPPQKYKYKTCADLAADSDTTTSTHFTVATLLLRKNKKPVFEPWTFRCASADEAHYWSQVIHAASRGARVEDALPTRRICVLVNPYGGTNKAVKLFDRWVRPMCVVAKVDVELRSTQHSDYAYEFGQSVDPQAYSAIVTLSGDGLLHQIVNGIMSRMDWQQAIKIPLGIIPGGTSNGLAKSLDIGSVESATLAVIKGRTNPMDVIALSRPDGSVTYGHLNTLWGIIADVDIESEKIRWAGSMRLSIWGLIRLLQLRKYQGRLHILPAEVDADGQVPNAPVARSTLHEVPPRFALPEIRFDTEETEGFSTNLLQHTAVWDQKVKSLPATTPAALVDSVTASANHSTPPSNGTREVLTVKAAPYPNYSGLAPKPSGDHAPDVVFPVSGQLPAPWETFEGPFVQVTTVNVPWIAADVLTSPHARLNDGTFDVVWLEDPPRTKLVQYLVDPATSATQLNQGHFHHRKARAIILEPVGRKVSGTVTTTATTRPGAQHTQPSLTSRVSRSSHDLYHAYHHSADPLPKLTSERDRTRSSTTIPNATGPGSTDEDKGKKFMKRAATLKVPGKQGWRARMASLGNSHSTELSREKPLPAISSPGRYSRLFRAHRKPSEPSVTTAPLNDASDPLLESEQRDCDPFLQTGPQDTKAKRNSKNRFSTVLANLWRSGPCSGTQGFNEGQETSQSNEVPLRGVMGRYQSTPSLSPTSPHPTSPLLGSADEAARTALLHGPSSGRGHDSRSGAETPANGMASPKEGYHPGILDIDGEEIPCGPVKLESIPGLLTMIVPSWFSETKYLRRIRENQRAQADANATAAGAGGNDTANTGGAKSSLSQRPLSGLSTHELSHNTPAFAVTDGLPISIGTRIETIDPAEQRQLASDGVSPATNQAVDACDGPLHPDSLGRNNRPNSGDAGSVPRPSNKLSAFPAVSRQMRRQQLLYKQAHGFTSTPSDSSPQSSYTSLGSFRV